MADIVLAQPLVATGRAITLTPALGLAPRHRDLAAIPLDGGPTARGVWVARLDAARVGPMTEALRTAAAATAAELALPG